MSSAHSNPSLSPGLAGPRDVLFAGLKAQDRDRYGTALFAPAEKQVALLVLYAFDHEISRISALVSEPMLGEIRLQWWRDEIERLFSGGPHGSPLVEAMGQVVSQYGLGRQGFDQLIDARVLELEDAPFETLTEIEAYADAVALPLLEMMAAVLGDGPEGLRLPDMARALTFARILRRIAAAAGDGKVYLPKTLLRSHEVDAHDLLHGRMSEGLGRVIGSLHESAMFYLGRARPDSRVRKSLLPIYLPLTLARYDLEALARRGFNPFAPELHGPQPGRILRLYWASLTRRI